MYSETLRWYSKNGHGGRCVLRLLTFTKDFLNNGITITGSTTLFKRNKKGISVFYWLQERIVMPVPWRHPWCIEERALSKRLAVQLLNKIFRFGCEPSCPDPFIVMKLFIELDTSSTFLLTVDKWGLSAEMTVLSRNISVPDVVGRADLRNMIRY
ncbi:hypothetical protein G5I_06133 [Acromyrmex echinatior]|uniref:Uncharacterized protein n=1 Tax=Acromyrmex echinatior TaxID=103372 RepID=F4WK83_ACREC|nr:hypothetical protein G5I_06133 [Acromyrmex echinatior]